MAQGNIRFHYPEKKSENIIDLFLLYKINSVISLFWMSFEYVLSTTFPTNAVLGQIFVNFHQS